MAVYILYHASCNDGFGSAWAAYQKFGAKAQYIPVQYGESLPKLPDGSMIYIVDFSYSRDVLLSLKKRCEVQVIDHHKTAFEALTGLDFAEFDMNRSGAVMTWSHFFPELGVPMLLQYIQDRDLWTWQLSNSKEINAAIGSYPMEFDAWDELADARTEDLYTEGKSILRHINKVVEAKAKQVTVENNWKGLNHKVAILNCTEYISDVCNEILQTTSVDFAATYFHKVDKRIWSLRSRGDIDGLASYSRFETSQSHSDRSGTLIQW
jgi:uncharacterized protein